MARSDPTTHAVEIRLFGNPAIFSGGRDITSTFSRRAIWMIAMLACNEGRSLDRAYLAGSLWPDSVDSAALYNLRQTLAAVRRALGEQKHAIDGNTKVVNLNVSPQVFIDVQKFDAACMESSPESWEEAADLYGGELLVGCDEPFAAIAREQKERAFLAVSDKLVSHYLSTGNEKAAIHTLRQILTEDPFREGACRSLMTALSRTGEWPAALESYREFRRRLRRELNTDVSAETKALYRSIRASATEVVHKKDNRHGVPTPLTELIGRASEITTVTSLVERCRLVTLCGPGGVGKTRLAIAVGQIVSDKYLDGAFFVDLAPLQDGPTILSAIASALKIGEAVGKSTQELVTEHFSEREIVLILDNCEHLTNEVSQVIEHLLAGGPGLHILATSRQSLGVRGEFIWNVPVLSVPNRDDEPSEILKAESVQLFLKCERRQAPQLRDGDVHAIASICRRLDGLPLAIELAAARTNVLSPQEIEKRLDGRFSLLTGGGGKLQRHQTLRACIDWSWDALEPGFKSLLMTLSVFRGGCSLQAIEGVANDELKDIVDLLSVLADRSLVRTGESLGETRYFLLETIREFASEKLVESGDADVVGDRHRDFFLAWSTEGSKKMQTSEELEWFDNFERDHDNLRSAISWCYAKNHEEEAILLTCMLCRFWDTHGHLQEGRERIDRAVKLSAPKLPTEMRSRAHLHAGWMASVQGDYESAIRHYESALPIFRELEDKWPLATTVNCLAEAYRSMKQYDVAERLYWDAIEIRRTIDAGGWAMPFCNLAELALGRGDHERAHELIHQSLKELGGPRKDLPQLSGLVLNCLAFTEYCAGDSESARKHAVEALQFFHESGQLIDVPSALITVALAETGLGHWERAVRLMGACESLNKAQGTVPQEHFLSAISDALSRAQGELGPGRRATLLDEGMKMRIDEAASLVLSSGQAASVL